MSDFQFEVSGQGRGVGPAKRAGLITLSENWLSIGHQVYLALGSPSRVIVSHDKRALALKLEPTSSLTQGYNVTVRKDTRTGRAFIKTSAPQRYIPPGVYFPISNNIFVHESVQK